MGLLRRRRARRRRARRRRNPSNLCVLPVRARRVLAPVADLFNDDTMAVCCPIGWYWPDGCPRITIG